MGNQLTSKTSTRQAFKSKTLWSLLQVKIKSMATCGTFAWSPASLDSSSGGTQLLLVEPSRIWVPISDTSSALLSKNGLSQVCRAVPSSALFWVEVTLTRLEKHKLTHLFLSRIGRKPVLIIGDFLFVIGAVLICSSFSLAQFIVGRVIMGGGVGIAAVVCAVYIGELAPSKYRGFLVGIQSIMITGGQFVAYGVSAGLNNTNGGWRILFGLSLPFAIGQGIAMHWLPESPRFECIRGNRDAAHNTLRQVYPSATADELELKLKAIDLMASVSQSLKAKHPSIMSRVRVVITTPAYFRCTLVASVIFMAQQLSGWNSMLYYSGTLFGAAGFTNPSLVGIMVAGVNALMTFFSMCIMDKVGRRRIFLIGVPIMVFALCMAAVAFHFMTLTTGGKLLEHPEVAYSKKWVGLMLGMVVLFIIGYAPSLGTLAYTTIEIIPLEVRGIGSGIAIAFQWSGNVIISATFLSLMNKIGPAGTYGFFGGLGFLGFIFIFFTYPEPAGLTIEQTGLLFTDGFGVKKADQLRAAQSQKDLELRGGGSAESVEKL